MIETLVEALRAEMGSAYKVDGPYSCEGQTLIEIHTTNERIVGLMVTDCDHKSVADLAAAVRDHLDKYNNPFFVTRDIKGKSCDFVYRTENRTVAIYDRCSGNTISFHAQDLDDKRYDNLPRFTHITKENIDSLQSILYSNGQQIMEKCFEQGQPK